jgi:hypothetical protein
VGWGSRAPLPRVAGSFAAPVRVESAHIGRLNTNLRGNAP